VKKSAIVVGAGLGGLSTAIRLQHAGWQVKVLEKNSGVGGRCQTLRDDEFTFDAGPTLLLMPDVLRALFRSVGRELDDYLELMRCNPNYRLTFGDGTKLDLSSDTESMRAQLNGIEPGAADALSRYLKDAGYKYRIARDRFVERNFRSWVEFLTLQNLYFLIKTHTLRKLDSHVRRYFRDPRLALAFTFQTMYLGLAPADAPSIYSLLPYTEIAEGIWHPRGGMGQISVALLRLALELGIEIETDVEVTRVTSQGRCVTGVETADDRLLSAEIFVMNADVPYAYRSLLPADRTGRSRKRLKRLNYGSSAFLLYLGLDHIYPELVHHNAYLSADPAANFDAIFRRRELPVDPSIYLCAASRTDPSMATAGKDALYILVPVPALNGNICWNREGSSFRDRVLNKLEASGLPDLRKHIVSEHRFTPEDFVSTYHTARGNAFGISHGFWQIGYMRPGNKASDLDNLYFVGASTVPGGGVPMVIIGSGLVAERVREDADGS
jgi:phytoene desaturase